MNKTFNNFFKLMKIEFKMQMTPNKIIIAFIIAFIPLINPMASNPNNYETIRQTWSFLGRVFSEAVIYAMLIRLHSVLTDNHSVDKNRTEYIVFPKTTILLAKTIIDLFLFLITTLTSIIGGILVIYYWKGGKLSHDFISNTLTFIVGISLFYLLVATGLRIIISSKKLSNRWKVINALFWIFLTLITYQVLSITIGVVKYINSAGITKYPVMEFYKDNFKWVSFIPFLNLGMIGMILYGFVEWYWMIPIISQCILFFVFAIKPLSRNLKEYLTI